MFDIILNNEKELIKIWNDLVGNKEYERFFDDFLGFFEECIKDDLNLKSDAVDALIIFFNRVKELIGDKKFFNLNDKIFIDVIKETFFIFLEQKEEFNYNNVKKLEDFFEAVEARFIKEYLDKANKLQEIMSNELIKREAPVSEILDGVLLIVLVGMLDSNRVMRIIDLILNKIEKTEAEYVIVDISNIEEINSEVANQIMKLTHAVKLMGTQALISGINSKIAKKFTHLQIDLGDLKTFRDIKYILNNINSPKKI